MRGHLTHVNFNTTDVIDVGIFISEYVFVEYLVVLVPCDTIQMVSLLIISETGDWARHIIKCIPQLFAELVKTPETPILETIRKYPLLRYSRCNQNTTFRALFYYIKIYDIYCLWLRDKYNIHLQYTLIKQT